MTQRKPRRQPTQPITAESLRQILATQVLGDRLHMPGDAELEELARVLEGWRRCYLVEEGLEPIRQAQRKGIGAIAMLTEAVEEIGRDNRNFAIAVAIGEVRRHIAGIKRAPLWGPPTIHSITGWRWLGEALREDFVAAMRPRNPDFDPGLSRNGPLVRFIAAIAPAVTGEHPSPASVATQLKALRRIVRQDGALGKTGLPAAFPP